MDMVMVYNKIESCMEDLKQRLIGHFVDFDEFGEEVELLDYVRNQICTMCDDKISELDATEQEIEGYIERIS